MSERLYGAQVLYDPDPFDRTGQCCGVSRPAIFPGVCTMDLLVDTSSSPRLRTVSHPIVDGFRAATNVSATRIFRMSGNSGISRRSLVIAGATLGAPLKLAAQDRGVETVEVTDSETATIDWPYLGQAHGGRQDRRCGAPFGLVAFSGDGGADCREV